MMTGYRTMLTRRGVTRVVGAAVIMVALTAAANPERERLPLAKLAVGPANGAAALTPVAIVDAFHAALAKGDTRAALDVLAEDVLIFESGEVERGRAEYANLHLAADAAFSAAVRRSQVSRSHGEDGNSAWVMSVEMVSGTYGERVINSRSIETMLLRHVAGQWRISHVHWSSKNIGSK